MAPSPISARLNCVADLPAVARDLCAAWSRPGGRIAICTIGRFCLWETLYYAARLQFAQGLPAPAGQRVIFAAASPSTTPRYAQFAAAFAPDFALQRWTGIGLFVPPSYVQLPAPLVRVCANVDRALARLPLLRSLADHRLLIFVRK